MVGGGKSTEAFTVRVAVKEAKREKDGDILGWIFFCVPVMNMIKAFIIEIARRSLAISVIDDAVGIKPLQGTEFVRRAYC